MQQREKTTPLETKEEGCEEENNTCCYDREYEHWTDDCGGRYCELRKISWCEWFNEDECVDCPFVCEYDED